MNDFELMELYKTRERERQLAWRGARMTLRSVHSKRQGSWMALMGLLGGLCLAVWRLS